MTSKQLVTDTLEFCHTGRVPRQMWILNWAKLNYPQQLAAISRAFPDDIVSPPVLCKETSSIKRGNKFAVGTYTDEWGCTFQNVQDGIAGEMKEPQVREEEWEDWENVHIPDENLTLDVEEVNRFCRRNKDKYLLSGCFPRPFERLQFIRGTENLYMDLMFPPDSMLSFMKKMHEHYCNELDIWAKTDVDALQIMDDWGAQNNLLINPSIWRELFKPMYKEYAGIAHRHGKKLFMHSDGNILKIIPDLIEIGVDALNSQIFCMGVENLKPFKGKITFWGEIDRQNILPSPEKGMTRQAVDQIYGALYSNGGCIAQCEFGPGARPENVYEVFHRWDEISG